jgi:hypothetical protein
MGLTLSAVLLFGLIYSATLWGQDPNFTEEPKDKKAELSPFALTILQQRIEELKARKLDDCRIRAIIDAEKYVDSLIIRESMEARLGVDGIPTKPIRPGVPDVILRADSLDVIPLFNEDSLLPKKPTPKIN